MIETELEAATQNEVVVELAGKITDRIKQLVYEDNQRQHGEFDPDEQAERIAAEYRGELVNHPEFVPTAIKKLVRETSGRIARAGVQILCEAEQDGMFCLILEPGQTFKVEPGVYVQFANATAQHFRRCVERIEETAASAMLSAQNLAKIVAHVCRQMETNGVNHFGELAKDNGQIEFSFV